ncbi:MAG: hypothetical protein LBC96_02955 [Lachnospiraceae bacterium]|jgi:hypothetical protein|nr:hypothetical protein [Lachnospiraceae bacterium]
MKKGWIVLAICVIAITFLAGLITGERYERERISSHMAASKAITNTIAVINMDMGAQNGGIHENYAFSIIQTLGEQYTLVSANMAYNGYQNGSYGAVITFPGDVSEKILSFNSHNPERVRLEYLINPNMPEEQYIDTYMEIISLQHSINRAISYMTINSFFAELHDSQDEIRHIFANDLKDMMALEEIQHGNFTQRINMDEIPNVELETKSIDMSHYVNGLNYFAEQVSESYLLSYAYAKDYYNKLKTDMDKTIASAEETAEQWLNILMEWVITYEANVLLYESELATYKEDLTTSVFHAVAYNDDLEKWHVELDEWYNEAGILHYQLSEWFDEVFNYFDEYLSEHDLEHEDLPLFEFSPPLFSLTPPMGYDGTSEFDKDYFESITVPESLEVLGLPVSAEPVELKELLVKLDEQLNTYDIDNYLSDDVRSEVGDIIEQYSHYLESVKLDLNRQYDENLLLLQEASNEYSNYFREWKAAALEAQEAEQVMLQETLDAFYTIKSATSNDNIERLLSFSTRMPESRTSAGVNLSVVDFAIQPFEITAPTVRSMIRTGMDTGETNRAGRMTTLYILICIIGIVLLMQTWIFMKKTTNADIIIHSDTDYG